MKFPGLKKQEVNLNFHKLQSVQITALNGHAKDALVFWKRAPLICLSFPILFTGCLASVAGSHEQSKQTPTVHLQGPCEIMR